MPTLPAPDRAFFNDNLRVQARFLLAANTATHDLALAVRDKMQSADATAHLRAAHSAALQMQPALSEAEHGAFENWYGSEHIFSVKTRSEDIAALIAAQ